MKKRKPGRETGSVNRVRGGGGGSARSKLWKSSLGENVSGWGTVPHLRGGSVTLCKDGCGSHEPGLKHPGFTSKKHTMEYNRYRYDRDQHSAE